MTTTRAIDQPEDETASPEDDSTDGFDRVISKNEARNIIVLAIHHVMLRTAWIFKTETVIMPAFLDAIAGPGWLRGCLPMLNRFGQSIPPMFLSNHLRDAPLKKRVLLLTSFGMAGPFLLLAAGWWLFGEVKSIFVPLAFLAIYSFFFMVTGLNQITFGTLQGKLVRPERRGRLMSMAGVVGSITSIAAAWYLLRDWLESGLGGFAWAFFGTGAGMLIAGAVVQGVREPADPPKEPRRTAPIAHLRSAWQVFAHDRSFRRLAVVAMLFATLQLLFPHFQALGRERLQSDSHALQLVIWVIVQNASVGVLSLFSGVIADRLGNR